MPQQKLWVRHWYIYIYIYIYDIYVYKYMCVCECVCVFVYIYSIYIYVYMYIYMYTHIYVHMYVYVYMYTCKYILTNIYHISSKRQASNKYRSFGYPHWNKRLPLISAASKYNTHWNSYYILKLNQHAYGPSMQTIKKWKYFWYLDFFIIFGLLIVKICVSFLFWEKMWQGFDI